MRASPRLNNYPATNRDLCAVGKHKAGDLGIDMHAVNLFSDQGSLEEAHGLSNRQEGTERTEPLRELSLIGRQHHNTRLVDVAATLSRIKALRRTLQLVVRGVFPVPPQVPDFAQSLHHRISATLGNCYVVLFGRRESLRRWCLL